MIHETAIVDGAQIGNNVKIWHFTHIREGAIIGDDVSVGQNVYIGPNVSIGSGTRIQNNVFIPEGVTIEENCFLGPSVVFTNDKYPPADKSDWLPTVVKQKAVIGANSTILPGITIGENASIGAGSVVTKSVQSDTLVYGNPARVHERK